MKCRGEPSLETHEEKRRMEYSSPWSFCIFGKAWCSREAPWMGNPGCLAEPPPCFGLILLDTQWVCCVAWSLLSIESLKRQKGWRQIGPKRRGPMARQETTAKWVAWVKSSCNNSLIVWDIMSRGASGFLSTKDLIVVMDCYPYADSLTFKPGLCYSSSIGKQRWQK